MASRSVAPALALLVSAALSSPAVAQQVQTPYGAMILSTYPNGVGRNPLATSWVLASQATTATLSTATSGQCLFIEGAFEDGFQYANINLTRWKPIAATALDHCPKPGAVGAANPQTCTAMLSSQIQMGVPLPGHPTGDMGMIMSLSQTPCATAGNCCVSGQCANWAGAHLSSNGCIHYGVLEIEAAVNIPPASGGVFFSGTYMYAGVPDPSWNEIDQTFINGPYGLEFHGSLFLSNPPYQSAAQEDKDVFDSTGTNCNSYVPAKGQPGNLKGNSIPYTCPTFSTTFAASYHTYKLIWTHNWLAWLVDTTVYRNSTAAPWRPVTMRPLLRTNVGTAASVASLPDAQVYVRRIRYTPLDDAGSVVQNALSCTSMAACFGNLAQNAAGLLQLSSNNMVPAGRRKLLQVGPTLSLNGSVLSTPTGAPVVTPYLAELASVSNATQYIVAAVLPGVLPSQVMVSITGHTISGTAYVSGFPFSAWTGTVQAAFVKGLADDVVPTPDQVYVTNAADASLPLSWQSGLTGPGSTMPNNAQGVLVSYTVDGYQCDPASTTPCNDAGFSVASSDSIVLNNIGPSNQVMVALNGVLTGYSASITDVSPGSPANPDFPQISAVVSVGINIFSGGNGTAVTGNSTSPNPTDLLEAMFDSALNSGTISAALTAAGIGSASAPTNVQTMRATPTADSQGGCPAWAPPMDPFLSCPDVLKQEEMYKSIMIAFIVAFAMSILGFFGGIFFMVINTRTLMKARRAMAIPPFGDDDLKHAPIDKLQS